LLCDGNERTLLKSLLERKGMMISDDVLSEAERFTSNRQDGITLAFKLKKWLNKAQVVHCDKTAHEYEYAKSLVRDEDDVPILAAFLASDADYLVTGDKDLLCIGRKDIINARIALQIMGKPAK
jgi:predicted nucleic acid-binding protein